LIVLAQHAPAVESIITYTLPYLNAPERGGLMDSFTTMGAISHRLEFYTDTLLIQGAVHGPFKRATDLMNRGDEEFIAVHKGTITALGQPPSQKVMDSPVMISRNRIHFTVDADAADMAPPDPSRPGAVPFGRESYIHKNRRPCYAITSVYVIYGYCHLLHDATLETLLRGDKYFPITKATIYLVARPNVSWQRDVAIVNRQALTSIYLVPQADLGGQV
jgi:hypothetical protein